MHKFEPKKHLILSLKNYAKKRKDAQISDKKYLTLFYENYAKKKKMRKFEPKNHLKLSYKNYAKKKMVKIRVKIAPTITYKKLR